MAEGKKHYLPDGSVYNGPTHKMPDGSLHSGAKHTSESKPLSHSPAKRKTMMSKGYK